MNIRTTPGAEGRGVSPRRLEFQGSPLPLEDDASDSGCGAGAPNPALHQTTAEWEPGRSPHCANTPRRLLARAIGSGNREVFGTCEPRLDEKLTLSATAAGFLPARRRSQLRAGLFALVGLTCAALHAAPAELWVAPNGDDHGTGTREQPLASVAMAQRKARELRRTNDPSIAEGIRIMLRGGV